MSDIDRLTETRNISTAVSNVYEYLKTEDLPEAREGTNVILLMGGSELEDITQKTYEMWLEDPSRVIVSTALRGKYSGDYPESEAERYFKRLVELGVPADKIIYEATSKNTIDELERLEPLLYEHGITPTKVLIVDRPIHQRRAFLNAIKIKPGIHFVNAPSEESFDLTDPENQVRIVEEIGRLISYKSLRRPDIPMDILRSTAEIRSELRKQGTYIRDEHHPRYHYKDIPDFSEKIYLPSERSWQAEE